MKRRGQLFLIEVIIAITVLIVLVTTLFAVQTFSPPPEDLQLQEVGNGVIASLVDSGLMFDYLNDANSSYYTLGELRLEDTNSNKLGVQRTVDGIISPVTNFKIFTERYNDTVNSWEEIDVVNFEVVLPLGSDFVLVEYYTPGFNGIFAQFKVSLYLWYEVS